MTKHKLVRALAACALALSASGCKHDLLAGLPLGWSKPGRCPVTSTTPTPNARRTNAA